MFFSVLLFIVASALANPTPLSVSPSGRLVDGFGREVTFHGLNYVIKTTPYLPNRQELIINLQKMKSMGLNGMRLGALWVGLQPTRDQRNATYLQSLVEIVQLASQYGVHCLIDMHQDLYSQRFCGDGAPLWAIAGNASTFPFPLAAPYNVSGQFPSWDDCGRFPWATYYATAAVNEAFGAFYNNTNGILDEWAQTWQNVAQAMASLGDAVLGYELLNEPWPGNVYQDPLLIIPTLADRELLQAAWDKAAAAIRTVDNAHAIFFEGITWDWIGDGFVHPPGGEDEKSRSVLSYHFYAPPEFTPAQTIDSNMNTAKALGCGSMLTEFFYSPEVMEMCDMKHQSWLMWAVEGFGHKRLGDPVVPIEALTRTYAPIVAGKTLLSRFDNATKSFVLIFGTDSSKVSNSTSVIYLNEPMHYPYGFMIRWLASTGGNKTVTWTHPALNTLVFTHDPIILSNSTITIEIFATPSNTSKMLHLR